MPDTKNWWRNVPSDNLTGFTQQFYLNGIAGILAEKYGYSRKETAKFTKDFEEFMSQVWGTPYETTLPYYGDILKNYQSWISANQPEDLTPAQKEAKRQWEAEFGLTQEKWGYKQAEDKRSAELDYLKWTTEIQERNLVRQREYEIEKGKQEQMAAWSGQMEAAARASTQRGMEDIRPLLEEAFEAGRGERLSKLTGYGDWIKRWDAIHQVNPYTVPQSEKIGQRISQLEGQPGGEAELARLREDAYGIAWAEQERFLREGARPTTPPTPGWLSEFVPGLKAGQPISRQNIPIPSGQQLTRMPWSQAQGLAGYAEWVGSPWQDILAQAQMMQPFTPNVASRWQPARQRR